MSDPWIGRISRTENRTREFAPLCTLACMMTWDAFPTVGRAQTAIQVAIANRGIVVLWLVHASCMSVSRDAV